jgi:methylthioribose-1-phosphate isomerase
MKAVYWDDNAVYAVDQTLIPYESKINRLEKVKDVCDQILSMGIRGATAIGVAGAFAVVLAAQESNAEDLSSVNAYVQKEAAYIMAVRPTGLKLSYAVKKMMDFANQEVKKAQNKEEYIDALIKMAQSISDSEEETMLRLVTNCASLLKDGSRIITHCHTGPLCGISYGSAAGGAIMAHKLGKKVHVFTDETRPRFQGAKINTFELKQNGVPFTLITDNMAGYVMANGMADVVMVAADRYAANGDSAAKIGVYGLAVLAKEHGVPFYMVGGLTSVDFTIQSGKDIVIEQRDPEEVRVINGVRLVSEDTPVLNPAFDITPADYITAIITEEGIVYPPYEISLKELYNRKMQRLALGGGLSEDSLLGE